MKKKVVEDVVEVKSSDGDRTPDNKSDEDYKQPVKKKRKKGGSRTTPDSDSNGSDDGMTGLCVLQVFLMTLG